jgi:hypothetical protein
LFTAHMQNSHVIGTFSVRRWRVDCKIRKNTPLEVCFLVGEVGLEPTRLIQPTDFKSVAYTNSATRP